MSPYVSYPGAVFGLPCDLIGQFPFNTCDVTCNQMELLKSELGLDDSAENKGGWSSAVPVSPRSLFLESDEKKFQ